MSQADNKAGGTDASAGVAPSGGEDTGAAASLLASEIKRRRVEAGLSQPQLARRIGYTRQYVSYAERVQANLPSLDIVRAIDAALDAGGALVALRGKAREEQDRVRRAAGRRGHDETGVGGDVDRREFFGTAVGAALGTADVFRSPSGGVGGGDVDRLVARTARLRRLDNYLGGRDTYRLYASELEGTMSFVRQARCTGATRKRLVGVVAEQAQLTGWAAFDAGMHPEAGRHYQTSLTAAREAEDPALAGNALAFLAYQEVTVARPNVGLAESSCAVAGEAVTPRVGALLSERRAWTYAVAGDAANADRSLALAREQLARSDDRPEPDWVYWVDRTEIDIMAGRCWAELHRPLRAVPVLESALSRFDDTQARDKALYLTWLAHALLDGHEIERAALVVTESFRLADGVGSVRPLSRIRQVAHRLEQHRSLPAVARMFDAIGA
ncbi:helix-turn-helix transcriptional regulator [Saccharothrix sp. Mg75]|uniref:helix-turn-helix transcriptional regulator n=1 Tax=Saccharothrix sp. Mg75 TaxID=3445357 RepID=UPI003EEAB06D